MLVCVRACIRSYLELSTWEAVCPKQPSFQSFPQCGSPLYREDLGEGGQVGRGLGGLELIWVRYVYCNS